MRIPPSLKYRFFKLFAKPLTGPMKNDVVNTFLKNNSEDLNELRKKFERNPRYWYLTTIDFLEVLLKDPRVKASDEMASLFTFRALTAAKDIKNRAVNERINHIFYAIIRSGGRFLVDDYIYMLKLGYYDFARNVSAHFELMDNEKLQSTLNHTLKGFLRDENWSAVTRMVADGFKVTDLALRGLILRNAPIQLQYLTETGEELF